jgi:RsiW-degrading membrane proteinase PrsW (M82 family)
MLGGNHGSAIALAEQICHQVASTSRPSPDDKQVWFWLCFPLLLHCFFGVMRVI